MAKLRWNDKLAACCEGPDGINAVVVAEMLAETVAETRRCEQGVCHEMKAKK